MIPNLIYDIGLHQGFDSEFYLRKGYNVIATDANPDMCAKAEERLRTFLDDGRLTILNVGIHSEAGEFDFFVNDDHDDWSSFVKTVGWRSGEGRVVRVETVPLETLVMEHGVPYYMKIDIEAFDDVCITSLSKLKELPKYVSVEATVPRFGERMRDLNYKRFKIISQVWHQYISLPFPPIEGAYVPQKMTGLHSGPFGDETYGPWLNLDEFNAELEKITAKQFEGSFHEKLGCSKEIFLKSWFDFHCALN